MSTRPGGPDWWMPDEGRWPPPPGEPWAPGPPPGPMRPRPRPWGFVVALLAVALVAGMVAAGQGLDRYWRPSAAALPPPTSPQPSTAPTSPPATTGEPARVGSVPGATGAVAADEGTVAFTDDFADPLSGWTTEQLASGTTFSYAAGRYVVKARGTLHHLAVAPFEIPIEKLSMAAVGTQAADLPVGTGFGVVCTQDGNLETGVRYEFLDLSGHGWLVERRIGTGPVVELRTGVGPAGPGPQAVTVEGVCDTLANDQTIRLVMFIDGHQVADFEDTAALVDQGWVGGLDVASRSEAASQVSFSQFEERDLSG